MASKTQIRNKISIDIKQDIKMNNLKMSIGIILFSLVIIIMMSCTGNNNHNNPENRLADTGRIQINTAMQEYAVDRCISNLLLAIVDSNEKFYPESKFFYSLSFKKTQHYKRMMICVDLWDNSENMDYVGIIKIKRSAFLCRGDISDTNFFHKVTASKLRVKLEKRQDQSELFPSTMEPVLSRTFYDCNGHSIYIDVYTKGKIERYP